MKLFLCYLPTYCIFFTVTSVAFAIDYSNRKIFDIGSHSGTCSFRSHLDGRLSVASLGGGGGTDRPG